MKTLIYKPSRQIADNTNVTDWPSAMSDYNNKKVITVDREESSGYGHLTQ